MVRKSSKKKVKKKKAKIIGPGKDSLNEDSVPDSDMLNAKRGHRLKKILATTILLFLIGFVIYALWPFMHAFLGAIIVYFLCRSVNKWLVNRGFARSWAAGLVLLFVFLLITIPIFFGAKMLVSEVSSMNLGNGAIDSALGFAEDMFPNTDIVGFVKEQFMNIGSIIEKEAFSMINNVANLVLNWVIFFFTLYYLLFHSDHISKRSKYLLPFSVKNRKKLFKEFKQITNSTVIATGAVGVIQGILIGIGFWIVGLPNPALWGFITMVFSMLPILGIPLVWIPAVAYEIFLLHNYGAAIVMAAVGLFATNIDYIFLRPWIQKRVGKLHPLITLLGIFMGIPIFGILGLILGPLILSIVITMTKMYLEENIGS